MKRSLSDWGTIAEIVAAVAITLSLVFVGFEIRSNTVATQAAVYQDVVIFDSTILLTAASDPDAARVFFAFRNDPKSLKGDEYFQGLAFFTVATRNFENFYLQREAGMISDTGWLARETLLRNIINTPGFIEVFERTGRQNYAGPFADYVTQVRAEDAAGTRATE